MGRSKAKPRKLNFDEDGQSRSIETANEANGDFHPLVDSDDEEDGKSRANGNAIGTNTPVRLKKMKFNHAQRSKEDRNQAVIECASTMNGRFGDMNTCISKDESIFEEGEKPTNNNQNDFLMESVSDEQSENSTLAELKIVKCQRKKCKNILKILSTSACIATSISQETQSTSGQVFDDQIARTLFLHETSIDSSILELTKDANTGAYKYSLRTEVPALQVLKFYSKHRKQKCETPNSLSATPPRGELQFGTKKTNWDRVVLALKNGLMRMELQQYTSKPMSFPKNGTGEDVKEEGISTHRCSTKSDDGEENETDTVAIRIILTEKAYSVCSPYNLPRKVPLRAPNLKAKKIDDKALAFITMEALGCLWQGSILDNLIPSKSPVATNRSKKGKKKEGDGITANMVYKAVDNAHSYLISDEYEAEIQRSDIDSKWTNNRVPAAPSRTEGPNVENDRKMRFSPENQPKIPGLVPKLRKYQEAAVEWMLERERGQHEDRSWEICWVVILDTSNDVGSLISGLVSNQTCFPSTLMPLYRYEKSDIRRRKACVLYNPFTGWLASNYEIAKESTIGKNETLKGGILAESMGLGKTVEVLACILSNPYDSTGKKICNRENCFEDKKDEKTPLLVAASEIEHKTYEQGLICFCGKADCNASSLSWVLCIDCKEAMHGQCAGFIGEEELIANTVPVFDAHKNRAPLRMCNAKRCPSCVTAKHALSENLIRSRATLIVTPPSILSQWEREIKRHTLLADITDKSKPRQPLKVKVYEGVHKLCSLTHLQAKQGFRRRLLHAHYLADADIVLTTFQALMSDLSHSIDNPYISSTCVSDRRASRKRKRYRVVPSPLMSIHWWRICLDEAQRVETPTAASARMALKLVSSHKWCVSGTPVGRGKMDDLYGLILFLRSKPFCEKDWFLASIKPEHADVLDRISFTFRETMWRSTKSNTLVRRQIGIPEQVENKVFLNFSSIERHFYQRQLEETILAADVVIGEKRSNNTKRKAKNASMLSNQLHRLRAACCHPQVGVGGMTLKKNNYSGTSVATGVLSMDQILDRLIDDAKVKAEEAQRLYTLNTNAIACLHRLKSESGDRGGILIDSEEELSLLQKSSNAYINAINVADDHASPSPIVGEAVLTGCNGFQTPRAVIRDGTASLTWVLQKGSDESANPAVWTRFDFDGASKKITCLSIQPIMPPTNISNNYDSIVFPRECVLQVSSAAVGGMFVDAISFTLDKPDSLSSFSQDDSKWQQFHGYRPHKSKSWRIYVKNYYPQDLPKHSENPRICISLEMQLLEPDIIPDSLQRLHILHNCALVLTSLQDKSINENATICKFTGRFSSDSLESTICKMKEEKESLESHYIEAARVLQTTSQNRLKEMTLNRKEIQKEFSNLCSKTVLQESWWNDLFAWCHLHPNKMMQNSLSEIVEQSLFELFNDPSQRFSRRTFPSTDTLNGLHIALSMRLQEKTCFAALATNNKNHAVFKCIRSITDLSDHPSEQDVFENSHCHKCRSDWDQKGPMCQCCKLEEELLGHQSDINDVEINCVLRSIMKWIKQKDSMKFLHGSLNRKHLFEKAEKYFELQDSILKELDYAKIKWRTHLDLLSDIDELNQCKRSMRLHIEGEQLFGLTPQEQAFIVQPKDISSLILDHTTKQAMAEGNLRRTKELLQFLRNQSNERKQTGRRSAGCENDDSKNACCICLCAFGKDRAVLRCGHAFHHSPCLEQLFARSGGGNQAITCPMRCPIRTKREEILIASDFRKDDGSKIQRQIQGSWGTKVDRLISDLMGVIEIGDKSIVFSQWDDMLHIMETALQANSIQYVRPKSAKMLGDSVNLFRSSKSYVLLLHLKHGAEGLTLVEANHIFMIEPLLNHSIDSQAINRIHRIGQTAKTFIHRYIIEGTIEVKIDRLREERQSHEGDEEEATENKGGGMLRAGGLDGGFNGTELQNLLK